MPLKILLPINIDRWRSSIATQMRAVVEANPDINFYSFSNPQTKEDSVEGNLFWARSNVTKLKKQTAFFRRYDVVQLAALSAANVIAATIAKIIGWGRTHVTSILCVEISQDDAYGWKYYQWARRVVDSFTSVSAVAGERAVLDEPDKYCGVIHNGYCPDYFSPLTDADSLCLPSVLSNNNKSYFVWVSSIERRKRPEVLIEIAKRMPDVNFAVCGYTLEGQSEVYVEQMSKLPNVHWLGLVERKVLRELYRNAAALFFPSAREGLPLAVMEAMGMGLQTIAQPKSSLPELVIQGINGYLIDESNLDGWEQACLEVMSLSEVERKNKAQAVHEFAAKNLTWHIAGKKYGDFYKLAAKNREKEWLLRGKSFMNQEKIIV
jgi:glycosyltransferase involved in cell wall biosynthesis